MILSSLIKIRQVLKINQILELSSLYSKVFFENNLDSQTILRKLSISQTIETQWVSRYTYLRRYTFSNIIIFQVQSFMFRAFVRKLFSKS